MTTTIYYHKHHIIPKSLGGTNHPDNIVNLTISGHAAVHKWMYEEYGRWEDKLAYLGLTGQINDGEFNSIASRESINKLWKSPEFRKIRSVSQKKLWEDPIFYELQRKKMEKMWEDPDFREKMTNLGSKTLKRLWEDLDFREMHSENMSKLSKEFWKDDTYRKRQTKRLSKLLTSTLNKLWDNDAYRKKKSIERTKMNVKMWENNDELREKARRTMKKTMSKVIRCEYCNRDINIGNYHRWHGDKCKMKKVT